MATIQSLVRSINRELVPQFEERLRAQLELQDRDRLSDLEVNEQILYARMIDVEETTLIV